MSLTPICEAGRTRDGHIKWRYHCSCGNTTETAASRVRNGEVLSCGCLKRLAKPNLTHGQRMTPTYASWMSAKDRATNPKSKDFHRYGAIGIGMAERWLTFENFFADMGERPPGKSIDRIDGSKGYEPGNCRWATAQQQALNRRDLVVVNTPLGAMPLVTYAKHIGLTKGAAHLRLRRGKLEGVSRA